MESVKDKLIKAVKTAVVKYGLSGVSTRNIADTAQVNNAYIYRYFNDKEDMLFEAYKYENGLIFKCILDEIDKAQALDVSFRERSHMVFVNVWERMLENPEQLTYCVFYYHSAHFKNAEKYHTGQLEELQKRLGKHFGSMNACTETMYALCTLLYDSAYSVISGQKEDTEEYRNRVFEMEISIIKSQMKKNVG